MALGLEDQATSAPISRSHLKSNRDVYAFIKISLALLLLTIVASFLVIVGPGQRGVLMQFGKVQSQVLDEGIVLIQRVSGDRGK